MQPRTGSVVSLLVVSMWVFAGVLHANGLEYPKVRRGAQVDVYHGVEVPDPYRWLEDLDAAETKAFIAAQETLFGSYLDRQGVAALERRIEALGETGANTSVPTFAGGRYFYTVQEPEQRLAVIFARKGLEQDAVAILDPNTLLSESQRLAGFSLSPGGRYLVYRVVETGTRWGDLEILDLKSGRSLGETIDGVAAATTVWTPDEGGFYYVDYGRTESLTSGASEATARLRWHRLGTDPTEDATVFARPETPNALFTLARSGDGRHLALGVYEGTADANRLFVADLADDAQDFIELPGGGEHAYQFLGSRNDLFYLYTNHGAPNGRVIAVDRRRPEPGARSKSWRRAKRCWRAAAQPVATP